MITQRDKDNETFADGAAYGRKEVAKRLRGIYASHADFGPSIWQVIDEIMERFDCVDCKVNTSDIDEYYSVRPEIWRKAGAPSGMLCVGCLETRLGFTLGRRHFTNAPINHGVWFPQSERLRARLGRR